MLPGYLFVDESWKLNLFYNSGNWLPPGQLVLINAIIGILESLAAEA